MTEHDVTLAGDSARDHDLEARAAETAQLLQRLANGRRLVILCKLARSGEMSVGRLADELGLSQSALSQHLALLRADNLVGTRRESQTIYYSIADTRILKLLAALETIFCSATAPHAAKPGKKQ